MSVARTPKKPCPSCGSENFEEVSGVFSLRAEREGEIAPPRNSTVRFRARLFVCQDADCGHVAMFALQPGEL